MEIRRYRKDDLEAVVRLSSLAFGNSIPAWEEYYRPEKNPRVDPRGIHVIEEDGEPRAAATVLPLEVFVDGKPVPMGGVAAVSTHPAYRRRGYAGELMRDILRDLRKRDVHLSMLWPFAHSFYRAYGWELVAESLQYRLKPTDLSTSGEQRSIRAYRREDLPRLMELFEERASRHPLCVLRSEASWRKNLERGDSQLAVYERAGRVEGYMLYRMSGWDEDHDPSRTLTVLDLVAATRQAREALLSLLAAQDPLVFEVRHSVPRGEPLHPYLESSYVKIEIEPQFMLRLVDVEGALGHLRRSVEPSLVLEVSDDVLPENNGEYTVGSGGAFRGAGARHRAALDVRQLAQLYAGYVPVRQLAEHGLVRPDSEETLRLLEALFPPGDPWVFAADHF